MTRIGGEVLQLGCAIPKSMVSSVRLKRLCFRCSFQVGDRVWIISLARGGAIERVLKRDKQFQIRVGRLLIEASANNLRMDDSVEKYPVRRIGSTVTFVETGFEEWKSRIRTEQGHYILDLHNLPFAIINDAIRTVTYHLSQIGVAAFEIVHGIGGGKCTAVTHQILRDLIEEGTIERFENPGRGERWFSANAGATVVHFHAIAQARKKKGKRK